MKLKAIHTYQYVKFQQKNENFLTARDSMPDLELVLLDKGVVSVKTAKDHILVFPTNIAYAIPYSKETEKEKVTPRGHFPDNDPSIQKRN